VKRTVIACGLAGLLVGDSVVAADRELTLRDVQDLMTQAQARGLVGRARKTRPVEARPARPGEIVVTVIAGEGKETQSRPAESRDWVVRNRCAQTGNEQYLVAATEFGERYRVTGQPAGREGWREARPVGKAMLFFRVTEAQGRFTFTAPWGERMVAAPGDAVVQDPEDPGDIYRVAARSFECTYEVLVPPS
jgi:hypothetical protein